MVNKVILLGRLGQDPETRTAANGTVVAKLNIATNERVKKDGEWCDHTEWHRVVCFAKTAENVARYLIKGSELYVEGKNRTNKWTDKDGVDRYTTEVVADTVVFVCGRGDDSKRPGDSGGAGGDW